MARTKTRKPKASSSQKSKLLSVVVDQPNPYPSRPKKSRAYITKKNVNEVTWLHGLIGADPSRKTIRSKSGVVVNLPGSLTFRVEDGVEYAMFPSVLGCYSGYIRFEPSCEKKRKRTTSKMNFLVLVGTIELTGKFDIHSDKPKVFALKAGKILTIPKGVKYGLKNTSGEVCYLRFQTIADESSDTSEE